IICTQPRRISAVGVAQRVADERCEALGQAVGFAVRGQSTIGPDTCLQFCTTGVLLRMLLSDPTLASVSCIIVDEVHERSVDSDFLLIILRELIPQRPDLRVILMSATLDSDQFKLYFGTPVALAIPGFTYPVTQVYPEDLFRADTLATKWKGGALQKATGGSPPFPSAYKGSRDRQLSEKDQERIRPYTKTGLPQSAALALCQLDGDNGRGQVDYGWIAQLVLFIDQYSQNRQEAILIFLSGVREISTCIDALERENPKGSAWDIFPLHANLSSAEQGRVFRAPTAGRRKVVVATNVAETSITIDDIVYVIDSGRLKETQYDSETGLTRLVETWAARAACQQRQGRAGRVQPGICFKLFTHHSQEHTMAAHQQPELLRTSLEQLSLQIKALGRPDVGAFLQKALNPPPMGAIDRALALLTEMSLLDSVTGVLTTLGQHVSALPVDIRLAKMLIFATLFRCTEPGLTVAALLALGSPFRGIPMDKRDDVINLRRQVVAGSTTPSDLLADAHFVQQWEQLQSKEGRKSGGSARQYARENYLSYPVLLEIRQFKRSLLDGLKTIGFVPAGVTRIADDPGLNGQADKETLVQAVILAGLYPNVVHVRLPDKKYEQSVSDRVFLHPSSVLFHCNRIPSQFVVYFSKSVTTKIFLRDATVVGIYALLFFGGAIEVDHARKIVRVGPWIQLRAWPRIGVLVNYLRKLMDRLLQAKIQDPQLDI
ncbi:P-loop containing nucleoside triphosphate hydrolase protein, partial [Dimargaris cristalligena]